jgi:hypothetical protein
MRRNSPPSGPVVQAVCRELELQCDPTETTRGVPHSRVLRMRREAHRHAKPATGEGGDVGAFGEACNEPQAEATVTTPDGATHEAAGEIPHDDEQRIPVQVRIDRQRGDAFGAAAVLDARGARFRYGEADVFGSLAMDFEVIAESVYRASRSGDIRGCGGKKEVESRRHARLCPLCQGANPEPLDRGTPLALGLGAPFASRGPMTSLQRVHPLVRMLGIRHGVHHVGAGAPTPRQWVFAHTGLQGRGMDGGGADADAAMGDPHVGYRRRLRHGA